jgi:hypothetical protein
MTQQFFVSRGRTIRGPVTNRKREVTRDGKVAFSGTSGASSPVEFAKAMPVNLRALGGTIVPDQK